MCECLRGLYTKYYCYFNFYLGQIPHKNIKNFTSDWNDVTAVAALVDVHAPGFCPEADSMDPNNDFENASHAMHLGDDWLGVPQVHPLLLYFNILNL